MLKSAKTISSHISLVTVKHRNPYRFAKGKCHPHDQILATPMRFDRYACRCPRKKQSAEQVDYRLMCESAFCHFVLPSDASDWTVQYSLCRPDTQGLIIGNMK